jgi:hypothetical protein
VVKDNHGGLKLVTSHLKGWGLNWQGFKAYKSLLYSRKPRAIVWVRGVGGAYKTKQVLTWKIKLLPENTPKILVQRQNIIKILPKWVCSELAALNTLS